MKIFIAAIKPYSRYRAGQPWAGVVVRKENFHAAESRYGVDMHAGLFEGTAERGGRLYIEAEPGDVIAWGQQGIRYRDTGENHGRVKADGSVETLPDKAAAYRLLDEMAAGLGVPADPVQPVVPENEPSEPAPQGTSEDPAVPEESATDSVQPVVPEDRGDQGEEVGSDSEEEPKKEDVVNPFGHD